LMITEGNKQKRQSHNVPAFSLLNSNPDAFYLMRFH